jgi:hypothetical protein
LEDHKAPICATLFVDKSNYNIVSSDTTGLVNWTAFRFVEFLFFGDDDDVEEVEVVEEKVIFLFVLLVLEKFFIIISRLQHVSCLVANMA